jgi:hypothetical protein
MNHVTLCEKSHIKLNVLDEYWLIMLNIILGGLIIFHLTYVTQVIIFIKVYVTSASYN